MTTFSITFTRGFSHTDWVDNVDRVEAGGDNGFNGRFHSLESDLDTISNTFGDVQTALNTLGTPPGAQTSFTTLTPAFVATAQTAWSFRDGFAEKPGGATSANGQSPIALPHNQQITLFRVVGQNTSASGVLRIGLYRRTLADPSANFELIARVQPTGNPFNTTANPTAGLEVVDNQHFSYFVLATVANTQPADAVAITAMQVSHTTH
jgi:hypothetical protein